ncbi:hypothetical protein FRC05_010814 [Tulasnella sp. 425]|nr:hypothetical protein FRC05_010814 [Tulasnella sp. 425]
MSESVGGPDGDSDTFAIAQHIMRLASSPWCSPTPESVEMALGIYQAAMKLKSPPVYESNVPSEVKNLQQQLDTISEELRATRLELQEAREETARAILALREALDRLQGASEGQHGKASSVTEAVFTVASSMECDTAQTVPVEPEVTQTSGINNIVEAKRIQIRSGDVISQTPDTEAVAPARASENRWTPTSVGRNKPAMEESSPELVQRKVNVLLNKLTSENFASVSDQIVDWVNRFKDDKNGGSLALIIKLVFEKATDESHWAEMYARLCRRMMEKISPEVQDEKVRNIAGAPIVGGQLFRKFLLNRCQEDFERGWSQTLARGSDEKEPELGSEEYYAVVKVKRQGIGLVQFIGELYKLHMLTERIIHECIKRLIPLETDNPKEAETETLCKLLTTVGETIDVPKSRAYMDIYFGRLQAVADNQSVVKRIRYMILRPDFHVGCHRAEAPPLEAEEHGGGVPHSYTHVRAGSPFKSHLSSRPTFQLAAGL